MNEQQKKHNKTEYLKWLWQQVHPFILLILIQIVCDPQMSLSLASFSSSNSEHAVQNPSVKNVT